MKKLIVEKGCGLNSGKIKILSDFILFCIEDLKISGDVIVEIVSNRDMHDITTTAFYRIPDSLIKVYGKDRALVDICRSVAHELTHMMQNENNMLNGEIQDIGGSIEDEANSKAGSLIKLYAHSSKDAKQIYESFKIKKNIILRHGC